MNTSMITIAQYIARRLVELGCRHVFGVPGTSCSDFFSTLHDAADIAAVVTANELEAGYAADGYARFSGLGACCVAYGVGTLSLINAIAGSLVEKVPVLMLNGGPSKNELHVQQRYGVLFSHSTGRPETDLRLFREVTIAAHVVRETEDIPAAIDAVLRAAITDLGPVYLEVPNDLWLMPIPAPAGNIVPEPPPEPGPEFHAFMDAALHKAAAATNPVFLIGVEPLRRGLAAATLEMIEANGYPFATTVLAKSMLPESHGQFRGTYDTDLVEKPVRKLLEESDCLIALGCVFGIDHLTLVATQYATMINVAFGNGRIGEESYAGIAIEHFLKAFHPAKGARASAARSAGPGYPMSYVERRKSWVAAVEPEPRALTHEALFTTVDEFLRATEGQLVTVLDTCLGSFPGANLVMHRENSYAANPVWLSIGHASPAANGVALATSRRPLIISGDGGFQMVVQSVSTMVKNRIGAILVVIDNGTYAIEQFLIDSCYFVKDGHAPLPFVALNGWTYERMPDLFGGGSGVTVNSREELRAALDQAYAFEGGPFVITARVPPNDLPPENVPYAGAHCDGEGVVARAAPSRWARSQRFRR